MRKLARPEPAIVADMQAAIARYTGPITYCPPGHARAHEVKESYVPDPPRPQPPVRPNVGNGRQPGQAGESS
jgi:hypothetical protein